MCRCCQICWEDFYWNCIEEKFCYDESIANYNPDDDVDYIASQKNGSVLGRIQPSDNNNLTVPSIICDQPLRRGNSNLMSNAKIHEEDYRRETQTNVPMLGPEIIAVFANSQIFQDHQPTKLNRISTKSTFLPGVHTSSKELPSMSRESEQDRLIRCLEANLSNDATDSIQSPKDISAATTTSKTTTPAKHEMSPEKRITFTLTTDSSPEGSQNLSPHKFDAIVEEPDLVVEPKTPIVAVTMAIAVSETEEVILRPRLIDRHPHLHASGGVSLPRKILRSAKSVPHFHVRSAASETDIFAISGSSGQISMTPEVPSISFSNLPKNYEDTPTVEKYRVSQSLYSIQTANAARATQDDYMKMPRYFRRSAMITQSTEMLHSASSSKDEIRRPEKEKSKRLQMLRGNLPPLMIHSVSFRKNREEGKQVD